MSKPKPKWNKESILALLETNDRAVERAIVVIFNNQTEDEKRSEDVKYHNGKGFLPMHARRGTYYAGWINSGKHLDARHLAIARRMSYKYSRQLIEAAKEKGNN